MTLSVEDVDALRPSPRIRIEHAAMMLVGHSPSSMLIHAPTPGMFKAYAALAALDDSTEEGLVEARRRWQPLVSSGEVSWVVIEGVLAERPQMGKALRAFIAALAAHSRKANNEALSADALEVRKAIEAAYPGKPLPSYRNGMPDPAKALIGSGKFKDWPPRRWADAWQKASRGLPRAEQ